MNITMLHWLGYNVKFVFNVSGTQTLNFLYVWLRININSVVVSNFHIKYLQGFLWFPKLSHFGNRRFLGVLPIAASGVCCLFPFCFAERGRRIPCIISTRKRMHLKIAADMLAWGFIGDDKKGWNYKLLETPEE